MFSVMNRALFLFSLSMLLTVAACSTERPQETATSPDDTTGPTAQSGEEVVLYAEDFENYENGTLPDDWWMEGGEDAYVEEGRLVIESDPGPEDEPGYVATVWNEKKFEGDVQVDFDARVLASSIDANNINFFLHYTYPGDSTLYETRDQRADASYSYYHELPGYITTFVKRDREDSTVTEARFRMRRCPGFELIDENYAYNSRPNVTYHVTLTKRGDSLFYAVDGTTYLQAEDEKYNWTEGYMGVRTFHTNLWVDNIRVTRPAPRDTTR